MDSIHFADVLFLFIVLGVTFAVLYLVNKAKKGKSQDTTVSSADTGTEADGPKN